MKKILFIIILVLVSGCKTEVEDGSISQKKIEVIENTDFDKIRVLNFGTAHLGETSDANSTMINLEDVKEKEDLKSIVEKIADFKPTVIFLELDPKYNEYVMETYEKFKIDQSERLDVSDELNSIGLEVGKTKWN